MSDIQDQPSAEAADLTGALVDALMTHAANDAGAVDYPVAAAAFASILAEMIGPQSLSVRKQMVADFHSALDRAIMIYALRVVGSR